MAKVLAVFDPPSPEEGQSLIIKGEERPVLTDVRNRVAVLDNGLVWLYLAGKNEDGSPGYFYGKLKHDPKTGILSPTADLVEGASGIGLSCVGKNGPELVKIRPTLGHWAVAYHDKPVWFGDSGGYPSYDITGRLDDETQEPKAFLQECGLMSLRGLAIMGTAKSSFFRGIHFRVTQICCDAERDQAERAAATIGAKAEKAAATIGAKAQ